MTLYDLRNNAAAKLQDAEVLFNNGRYDGAKYLCGYAVELSLKAKICDTLSWSKYPPTEKFLQGFKIHHLDTLLLLTGRADTINQTCFSEWAVVKTWDPEMRYHPAGHTSLAGATAFLQATRILLQQL